MNTFDEQIWSVGLPKLKQLNGALMIQGALGNVVVVGQSRYSLSGLNDCFS